MSLPKAGSWKRFCDMIEVGLVLRTAELWNVLVLDRSEQISIELRTIELESYWADKCHTVYFK